MRPSQGAPRFDSLRLTAESPCLQLAPCGGGSFWRCWLLAACIPRGERRRPPRARETPARAERNSPDDDCNAMSISPASGSASGRCPTSVSPAAARRSARCSCSTSARRSPICGAMTCPLARQFARWVARGGAAGGRSLARQPGAADRDASAPMPAGRSTASRARGFREHGLRQCGRRLRLRARRRPADHRAGRLERRRRATCGASCAPIHQAGCRRFSIGLVARFRRLSLQPSPFRHGARPLLPLDAHLA